MTEIPFADQLHRYSVDEYEELVLRGAFEDQRVELIDGLLVDMSPISPAHENGVAWLHEWFTLRIDRSRYQVRGDCAVRLATSEPQPDIAVIERDKPRDSHATAAVLVIEVALSSRERDLRIKPRLYAPVVGEYWVLDIERAMMVVHRDPARNYYRRVSVHGREALLRPERLELPEALPMSRLLGEI